MIRVGGRRRNPDMPKLSLLLIVGLLGAGCGSDANRPTPPSGRAIAIEGFKFAPENVTVDVGASVTWTNEDAAPHTATADDGSFDTGDLREEGVGSVTFGKAGSFAYFCEFHKFMRAKVTVR